MMWNLVFDFLLFELDIQDCSLIVLVNELAVIYMIAVLQSNCYITLEHKQQVTLLQQLGKCKVKKWSTFY